MENAHDGALTPSPHLIRLPYDVCVLCAAATLDDGSPNQVGAGRVRGPGQIGMLISICDGGCEAGGAEGRANEKDAIGYWQVAATQRGGAFVEISLGKLCTTLDHGTLRVGIRVSCHISHQQLMPPWSVWRGRPLSIEGLRSFACVLLLA